MRGLRRKMMILEDSSMLKGENIMEIFKGTIEYKMPEAVANSYLKARKGNDKKLRPTEYLCKIVNEEYGLKGYCVNVITF